MNTRFLHFVPFIIKHEVVFKKGHYGDYNFVLTEHDPNDPGGTTRFGIDYGEHKERPWSMSQQDIDRLTLPEAQEIYWKHWQIDNCDRMPGGLGEAVINCATMSGLPEAKQILSRQNTIEGFLKDELSVFDAIVRRRPKAQEYLSGWKSRIYDEAKFLGVDIV